MPTIQERILLSKIAQLEGKLRRTNEEVTDLLTVALQALKRGHTEVVTERIELSIEMLNELSDSTRN